jgi:hypothetical protein
MWIDANHPNRWDACLSLRLNVCLAGTIESAVPVDRIGTTHPQVSPQEKPFSHQLHILETVSDSTYIWGYRFMDIFNLLRTSPQRKALIHR